jgi:DinB superfamily
MKSVYDASTREELIKRINSLSQQNNPRWGKMNVFQMIKHCTLHEDMVLGKLKIKRVLPGLLFGPTLLKRVLKDNSPFGKNSPTSSLLKTTKEIGDIEHQKKEWINRIEQYTNYSDPHFIHPFFGPMTKEQIGFFAYKHNDHHLRQFGA